MATPSPSQIGNQKYVTVEKGDNLYQIASDYLGAANKYKTLAAINDIKNPDLIYVGQKVYLYEEGSPKDNVSDQEKAVIKHFGLQSDDSNILFATWNWTKTGTTENYQTRWEYQIVNGIWFVGTNSPTDYLYSTYTIPDKAKKIRFRVRPVCKEDAKDEWSAAWTSWEVFSAIAPATPRAHSVELTNLSLTASVSNVEEGTDLIQFQVVKDDSTTVKDSKVKVTTNSASYTCNVEAGGKYKVRCRAISNDISSAWTDYSANFDTIPATPSKLTKCAATSTTSIGLEWAAVTTATSYDIQYTTDVNSFDTSDNATTKKGITSTKWDLTNVNSGEEYFFRVRAVNDEGSSGWSEVSSTVLGEGPSAPTTWSSTSTAIVGEPLNLHWVHNSKDGSSQTRALLELTFENTDVNLSNVIVTPLLKGASIEGTPVISNRTVTYTIKNTENKDDVDKTSSCSVDTSVFAEGVKIRWRVCTMGVVESYGDFSTERIVDIYLQPTITLTVKNSENKNFDTGTVYYIVEYNSETDSYISTNNVVLGAEGKRLSGATTTTGEPVYSGISDAGEEIYYYMVEGSPIARSFPFNISAITSPRTQAPIGYHLSIIANEAYDTVDNLGNEITVTEGEQVYSKHFDVNTDLETAISAGDVTLENGVLYTLVCVASMDSGLTTEESKWYFVVKWDKTTYTPNAEITIDPDNLSASIRPYCVEYSTAYRKVTRTVSIYTRTDETVNSVFGERVANTFTTTGEQVYQGVTGSGDEIYYCIVENSKKIEDVILSVYRRESDGSFTEIASGIDGASNTTVVDPHPALDYARYRIVAMTKTNGAITYTNAPGCLIGEKAIIIQWDEEWSSFDIDGDEDSMASPPWSGSLLKLPYNVDISDKRKSDVVFVEYIGRKHPVSYYGTQLGETSTWNVTIEKDDKETIYALRRLGSYMGDVYVREPSGTGYWANVVATFSQKHCEQTIPVTIEVTRVEGGV